MEICWHHYFSLDSTNDKALKAVAAGKMHEGEVVWADEQWQGKGTGQNSWESDAGKNLSFSLVLEPHFILPSEQFLLTQVVSLAIQQVLDRRIGAYTCQIKWPNDLYISSKKVGGILIQNLIKGSSFSASVVGVGINVNQEVFHSDAPNPASMIHFSEMEIELFPLLEEVIQQIDFFYEKIKDRNQRVFVQDAYLNLLIQKGSWASYSDKQGAFEGRIVKVDDFGRLQIEDRKGTLRLYGFKEVIFER